MKSAAAAIAGMLILIAAPVAAQAQSGKSPKAPAPPARTGYDKSRFISEFWSGEYPARFSVTRNNTILMARTAMDNRSLDANRGYLPTSRTPFSFASRRRSLGPGMPCSLWQGAKPCRFADHPTTPIIPGPQVVAIARNRWSRSIGTPGWSQSSGARSFASLS